MKDGEPHPRLAASGPRAQRPTRRLNLASRLRSVLRRGSDRVLGADLLWSGAFVVVVFLLLGIQRCGVPARDFAVGDVAPYDLKASYDVDVVDEALSAERLRQAVEAIPDVYVHDRDRRLRLAQALSTVFEEGRHALDQVALAGDPDPQSAVERELGARVAPEALATLLRLRFDVTVERELSAALIRTFSGLVVGNKTLLERAPSIVLVHQPGERAEKLTRYDGIIDVEQARDQLARDLAERLRLPPRQVRALAGLAGSFVDANMHLDWEATTERKDQAARQVPPVLVRVARGDILIKKGERFTPEALAKLDLARQSALARLGPREALAQLFLVCMLAFFLHRYCTYHQRGFKRFAHLHALLVLMLLSMLLLGQGTLWLAREVTDGLAFPFSQLGAYTYLIPVGAGSILVALLANGRIAIVYSAFFSLLFGATTGADYYATLWSMVVQLCGVYAISTYRERAALLRAGLVVGGGGAATALAVEALRGSLEPLSRGLYGAGLAFLGGALGVVLLISFSLPLLEGLFGVLTDLRLLELSNVNNPLLSELAIKAPGSYNHSLVVGTLAEEGAKSIGANSLFCRVAAFYHDIGKIQHPEYYVENQRGGNPHDRLSPSMSALIIASHVKDGIKLAREAGLPEQLIDVIPQHHGTKLMTYFYEKAKTSADPALGPVKEQDFRYPGPKPQTREAAIFMLADAVEAAARTVEEATPNRLREMIRKILNSIVLDGQLDSCDLTFADLERIQEAFLRLLVSMHHHRVDYPGFDFRGDGRPEPRPAPDLQDRRLARGS